MAVSGDILQITWGSHFTNLSNRGLNVFQYELVTDDPINLAVAGQYLFDAWYTQMVGALQPITSSEVVWDGADILNLTSPDEIWSGNPTDASAGAVSGDSCPPFVSWGFLLRRTTRATRNGYKRFWGVPESMNLNGEPTGAAALLLIDVLDFLGNAIILAPNPPFFDGCALEPVIVRKDGTGALLASQPVTGAEFRAIGSQNTRKIGRGM